MPRPPACAGLGARHHRRRDRAGGAALSTVLAGADAPARAAAPDQDRALLRIRRQCAEIRARVPAATWDLAVIETAAGAALDRGCRPADVDVICRRLQDLLRCVAGLSEDLGS